MDANPSIVILYSTMGPYHWARAKALAAVTSNASFFEVASREAGYSWDSVVDRTGVGHRCLFPGQTLESIHAIDLADEVSAALDGARPHAVFIPGYDSRWQRRAARWAKDHHAVSVLMTDSWERDRPRQWWKEWIKGRMIRGLYDAAFAGGERAAAYASKLGVPYSRIWRGVDVVDNEYFDRAIEKARDVPASREQRGLPESYFLFLGRYIPEKNLPVLLRGFAEYRRRGGDWHLVCAGFGDDRPALLELAEAIGVAHVVQFRDRVAYKELPTFYAWAGCLVLASRSETWGLVVNEALASGVPVIVSDQCGCVPELCRMGVNGYVFDHRDASSLAAMMARMAGPNSDRGAMGSRGRELIRQYSPTLWARSVLDCAETMRAMLYGESATVTGELRRRE